MSKKRIKSVIVTIDDVYRIINRVQLAPKEAKFDVKIEEAIIVENILRDAEIEFQKEELKTKTKFVIYPQLEEKRTEKAYDEFEQEFGIFDEEEIIDEEEIF